MEDRTSKPKRLRKRWIFLVLLLIAGFIVWPLWFYEYGIGEHQSSPDGRYTANLHRYYERTVFDGEIEYVRANVIDAKTKTIVWEFEYKPTNISILHDYGIRGQKFIQWNATSTEVTLPLDTTGKQIVVPMP